MRVILNIDTLDSSAATATLPYYSSSSYLTVSCFSLPCASTCFRFSVSPLLICLHIWRCRSVFFPSHEISPYSLVTTITIFAPSLPLRLFPSLNSTLFGDLRSINWSERGIANTLILRTEMKSTLKLFGVPSEYFVAFFISLRRAFEYEYQKNESKEEVFTINKLTICLWLDNGRMEKTCTLSHV